MSELFCDKSTLKIDKEGEFCEEITMSISDT